MFILKTNFPKLFGADAITIAPFVLITEESRNDSALIAHERVHYKEQLKALVIPWWILYLLSSKFRLNAEVRAYKVQIALGGIDIDSAAWYLSNIYRLKITQEEAKALLS